MENGVYKLKEDTQLGPDLNFKRGQEFEVVDRVVYMDGYPLPPDMQVFFGRWIDSNLNKFVNVTRNWKKGGSL